MRVMFEQVFYGCGSNGYAVLGASFGAKPFVARVEELCGAVGTPVSDYGGEPFLLSFPDGNRLVMVCGRRGKPDSVGRGTLFFHALIVAKKDLDAAMANAFSLFDQGTFAAALPDGAIEHLQIDFETERAGSNSRPSDKQAAGVSLPCFVRSSSPVPDVVRLLADGRINELAWTTFAFRAMPRSDIQVLPPRVPAPVGATEYDTEGHLVRRSIPASHSGAEWPRGDASRNALSRHGLLDGRTPYEQPPSTMFKLSIAVNVALALLCMALWARRSQNPSEQNPPDSPEPIVVTQIVTNFIDKIVEKRVEVPVEKKVEVPRALQEDERKAIEKAAVDEFRKELASSFPEESRILDFNKEKNILPRIEKIYPENGEPQPSFSDAQTFLEKVKVYVSFLNTKLNLLENYNP